MLRRWELGNALRRIREERGMTIAEATTAMEEHYGSSFSATKLSRMETAKRGVIPRDVHDLCLLYDVPDADREYLVGLAKSVRGPEMPGDDQSRSYLWFAALEQVATEIREYSAMFLPGLLQTLDYARVVESLQFVAPDYYGPWLAEGRISDNADDRVKMRIDRQRLLERPDPVRLHVVIDAGALRRRLPDPGIMHRQIGHLIEMSKRPNITIQVMPFEAGLYPGSESAYWSVLDFPPGDDQPQRTVYVETHGASQLLERESEVNRMAGTFAVLSRLALTPEGSRSHMEDLLHDVAWR
jgi:hypothetical protein